LQRIEKSDFGLPMKNNNSRKEGQTQVTVTLSQELLDKLTSQAKAGYRSRNAHILMMLNAHLEKEDALQAAHDSLTQPHPDTPSADRAKSRKLSRAAK